MVGVGVLGQYFGESSGEQGAGGGGRDDEEDGVEFGEGGEGVVVGPGGC